MYPDGTKDSGGLRFWNATDACCNFAGATTDDSAYLMSIVGNVRSRYSVDPKRIYVLGHSNGGFMAYRMACEHADTIAAIVSLAGATFDDATSCKPSQPVSVLQIHGSNDGVISYTGGQIGSHAFPSATKTVTTWAQYNGCEPTPVVPADRHMLDLDPSLPGNETGVTTFSGCRPGGSIELLTIDGGAHSPKLSASFPASVIDFLYAHRKP